MKKIFAMLSLLSLSTFSNSFINDFDTEVNNAYDQYQVYDEYTNSYYSIKIIYGLIDENVRYGLCFYSDIPKEYNIRIIANGKSFDLDKNSRGDVSAVALNLVSGETFSIAVYNKSGILQHPNKFDNIRVISKDEFLNLEQKIDGNGNGIALTKLKNNFNFDFQSVVFIIFAFVIIICSIIIYVFYKRRKGMFAADVKSSNVFNFKEFLNSTFEELPESSDSYETELDNNFKEQSDYQNETYNEKYVPHYSWARDEEERSDFDIKNHLRDLGYVSDYSIASEEEKNQIMLELMRLRDQQIITKDDYLEETSKLWKI